MMACMSSRAAIAVVAAVLAVLAVLSAGCGTSAGSGQGVPAPSNSPEGVRLDPALAQRLRAEAGSQIDLARVIVAGQAGDETIVVVKTEASEQERTNGGRAAAMWIAKGDKAFRRAAEYLSYDLTCRDDDPVCPQVRSGGLGFAALRRQDGGRVFAVVAATRDRSVEVTTAEGKVHPVGVVPDGAIVELSTTEPYKTRFRLRMADGRTYSLHLPPFAVVGS